ncbi:hypothetical protein [Plantactinospora sp. GCM10030261]|uniref:hypothetical protein n=1 Tax=Plantactinospora sp. GCM10030261 TaxID=3273420 RepID=UPI00361D178C
MATTSPVLRDRTGVLDAAASALGGLFAGLSRVRHDKPIHTPGSVYAARFHRAGVAGPWSTPWLTEGGEEEGIGRLSRAVGLPWPLPDVLGLALRFPGPEGRPCDLLLSTTGLAPVARHLMLPRVAAGRAVYSTLFPYRDRRGAVLLAALPDRITNAAGDQLRFVLAAATPGSRWRPFGTVELTRPAGDPPVTFDPVRHPLPGLFLPDPVARLRAVSYAAARQARGSGLDAGFGSGVDAGSDGGTP